ncbi:MAG: flagellar biosynthesis protein FlhF [Gammaproteobacteria bacterium]|nr:flagellar biosynthesis protein FlhF [Gammaproteobacteria bacterium]
MKIKRFIAKNMRQAIRDIRAEQGPDAVILSNQKVAGGIEVISAVDYDESIFEEMVQNGEFKESRMKGDVNSSMLPEDMEEKTINRPGSSGTNVEWMNGSAISEMREEINGLRGILENRLSYLAWSEASRGNPKRAAIMHRLANMGISADLAKRLADNIGNDQDLEPAWRQVLSLLTHQVMTADDDILTNGGVVALIGPTGVGKTTTVAKLAARYALRHGQNQVALISIDNYRIGGYEQLLTYGRILGVAAYTVDTQEELYNKINELGEKRLIIIDTAGASQRDIRLPEQLSGLNSKAHLIQNYLVLSANTQLETLDEVVCAFQSVKLEGCILTKLDEATSLGEVLSTIIKHGLPAAYVSDGQRVPEDLQPARGNSLVTMAATYMQRAEMMTTKNTSSITINGKVADAYAR